MKFMPVGSTSIAWSVFLKEMPTELVNASNRYNAQSVNGYLHLLSQVDFQRPVQDDRIQPYLLELWHWTFYFHLYSEIIAEIATKTNLKILSVQKGRVIGEEHGLIVGNLKDWLAFAQFRDKPYVSSDLSKLAEIVRGIFGRENLSYLLEDQCNGF